MQSGFFLIRDLTLTQAKQYDKAGVFARSGSLKRALLDAMLEDAYFKKNPPKSTGREYFHLAWLEGYTKQFPNLNKADIQRTLLELTAKTIADTLNHYTLKEAIFCGGGIKNSFLMERIDALTQCKVTTTDVYDISSDFLEAMLFAWLAYKRLHHEKVALKTVTGAKEDVMLGAIYG